MGVLLVFLSSVIASYWALTDPVRLRAMAQTYLSDLVGGPVSVGSASLSLLQGLRLSDVKVKVDTTSAADATLFSASAIDIGYDPGSLLRGRLEVTRIVATDLDVTLVESTDTGRWNYQRLKPRRGTTGPGPSRGATGPPPPLPLVVLRDAHIHYIELAGNRLVLRGSMDVGGRVFPSDDASRYLFEMQSRGAVEGVGPVVAGQVQLRGATAGQVDATLAHFRFGRDVEAMLPREVRDFWQAHQLQGAVDIPEFRYTPANRWRKATFRLRTGLRHVRLVLRPEELDPTLPVGPSTRPSTRPAAPPLVVDDVSGEYLFDQDGIRFRDVRGTLLGNTISATGTILGYSPDAAVHVRLETPADVPLNLPPDLPYLASLPKPVRDVYDQLKPSGVGTMWMDLDRPAGHAPPRVTGRLTILRGAFQCIFFPYPVHDATGTVALGVDPVRGFPRIDMIGLRGYGVRGGPNADRALRLDGWVGPLNREIGCGIRIAGEGITNEPPLLAAFAPPVRAALAAFQGPAGEPSPAFRGDFVCHVDMPVGLGTTAVVTADLTVLDGTGRLAAFPYPLEHVAGQVHVGDGFVDLTGVTAHQGSATMAVDGRVSWTTGPGPANVQPNLTVSARNVPLDRTLLAVLPPATGRVVGTLGAAGLLDVDGHLAGKPPGTDSQPSADQLPVDELPVDYDLNVSFHHGTARPLGRDVALSDVTAQLHVLPDRIDVRDARGRRGVTVVSGTGTVDLPPHGPAGVRLSAVARSLTLDRQVYALLPPSGRGAWDALDPRGAVDVDVDYRTTVPRDGDSGATRPAPPEPDYRVTLRPRDLTLRPRAVPYRLDHVVGLVTVDPNRIDIRDLRGTHGSALVAIAGQGLTPHPDRWDLTLSTRNLPVNADLLRALPAAIRAAVDRIGFRGNLDLDLTRLDYRGGTDPDAADLDVAGVAKATAASLDVGVPLTGVAGRTTFAAAVRDGHLAALRGDLDLDTLSLADRPVRHLRAHLEQPAGSDAVHLTDVQAELAGGRLAGRVDLRFPTGGASTTGPTTTAPSGGGYAVTFAVTDADVATIAGSAVPGGKPLRGRLSASLDLQGDWADPASRRGRGDVLVTGRDMYQIPLVLGLLEVTDLSLPTSAPFNQATARYAVDGKRVTFEQLQMRGDTLLMSGTGWLDFGTKRVRMNFTTDNPRMAGVPVLHELWQGAKQELLQIQVRGTVQDPQVSAASLHTFTTTVDEVFSGGDADR